MNKCVHAHLAVLTNCLGGGKAGAVSFAARVADDDGVILSDSFFSRSCSFVTFHPIHNFQDIGCSVAKGLFVGVEFPVLVVEVLKVSKGFTFTKLTVQCSHRNQFSNFPVVEMRSSKESLQFFGFVDPSSTVVDVDGSS